MKKCSKCKADKPTESFSVDRVNPDGRQYYCKQCAKEYRCTRTITKENDNANSK